MNFKVIYLDLLIILAIISTLVFVLPNVNILYTESIRDALLIALGIEITKFIIMLNKKYVLDIQATKIYRLLSRHQIERDISNFSNEEDLLRRNEALIRNSLQKIQQNSDRELRYIGIKELRSWANQDNIDKYKLAELLLEIAAGTRNSYFKKVLLDIICKDFRDVMSPKNHKVDVTQMK